MVKPSNSRSSSTKKSHGRPPTGQNKPWRAWVITLLLVPIGLGIIIAYFVRLRDDILIDHPLFRVTKMPRKHGVGLIAKRNISQGTLIFREKPLFRVPSGGVDIEKTIDFAVSMLSPEDQHIYHALSYQVVPNSTMAERNVAIFRTNSFVAGEQLAIFPTMARLNHGCSFDFNVAYNWREKEGELYSYALRDINEGEELLTEYMSTKQPSVDRQKYLQEHYNFRCSCAACSLPEDKLRLSDDRLSKMQKLEARLEEWNTGLEGLEITRIIRQIWELEEEEGFWTGRGHLAQDATTVAAAHSDEESTREWAAVARKWYTIEFGDDHVFVRNSALFNKRPQAHSMWGSRTKMKVEGPPRYALGL